jgi:20S proteasome alpha/beta subunit
MKKPLDDSFDSSDFVFTGLTPSMPMAPPPAPAPDAGPATGSPIEVSDEVREAEAAYAASGSGGTDSVVSIGGAASAGLTINLLFDANAMAAPQPFRDGITAAMQMICAVVTDKITINIQIDYSGTGGGAAAGPSGGAYEPYSTVLADLVNNATPGDTTFSNLPAGSTIAGQSQVAVWYSQLKLWGLVAANGSEVDGSAIFSTDINPNLLVGVALHELTHAMGRVPYGPTTQNPSTTQPDIFDFYRFTSAGNILINGNSTAPAAYFSLDGGASKLADYGRTSDPSDFLNSGVQGSTDPFNEFYNGSTQQSLTAIDLIQLDALGFHLTTNQQTQTVIEAFGSTKLVQVGSNFFLNPVAGGTGPELKYGGVAFVAGSTWGAYAPIGAEAISGGYEVAFKAGADSYTVWDTDANGNITTNVLGTSSGSSAALETLETSFQQDLNGDHVIGVPAPPPSTTIEAFGSTKLVQSGNNFFLNPVAGGTGPELKYGGTVFVAGSTWGSWAPIGAEAISGGYEVAFKTGADSYTVWDTDANGNLTSIALGTSSGSSTALESMEVSFQQDLNGDHIIGIPNAPPSTTIEAFGQTTLVQTGNNYFLNPTAGGTGPELKYGGSAFTAGTTWGAWAPIGAEAISGGYEVAFKQGTDTYTVWDTDANGNLTSVAVSTTSGSSVTLESLEPSFQQDLNGDHVIGVPNSPSSTTIEAFGQTTLVQTGSNYFLNPTAGGSGPELKYGGSAFTAGATWGAWAPIGAEPISGGYEVAFKQGTDTYTVWNTDVNGNLTSVAVATTSGSSTALESLEVSFQQDLNGDHIIGVPGHTSPSTQVASTGGGDNFVFRSDPGSTGTAPLVPLSSPVAGDTLTAVHTEIVQQVVVADAHDVPATHDAAVPMGLFDPMHGFIFH